MKKLFAGLSMAIVIVLCLSACGPSTKQVAEAAWTAGTLHEQMTIAEKMGIKLDIVGVRNGWASWPYNFDPTWLNACNGFKKKAVTSG